MQLLLKDTRAPRKVTIDLSGLGPKDMFRGIRCPACSWQPSASSRWCCVCDGTPEPACQGCGTVWNTFATAGRCPGCSHQWQWTTCLQCGEASLHIAWYEERD